MTTILADIVDSYLFRLNNGTVQFLLLQRQREIAMGGSWHGIHGTIAPDETALEAAKRTVYLTTGLTVESIYSADFINQFYDPNRDAVILAPVFAFTVAAGKRINLSEEYVDAAWFETEEATARLPLAGQRWAVRHIEEIIGLAGDESEYYLIR